MEQKAESSLTAARARQDKISAELKQVSDRINEVRPKLGQNLGQQDITPGSQLDRLLSNGPKTFADEYAALMQRQALLHRAEQLAMDEVGRLANERSSLLKRAAQPELFKLRVAAVEALDKFVKALSAVDAAHEALGKQGADLTSGYFCGHDFLNAFDLADVVQSVRRQLDREQLVLQPPTQQRKRIRLLTPTHVGGKACRVGAVVDCNAAEAALLVFDGQAEFTTAALADGESSARATSHVGFFEA